MDIVFVTSTVRSNQAMGVLKWPTLEEGRRKSVFKLVKKCLQGQCPQYFEHYFKRNNTIHARPTRQSSLLHPPAVRTEIAKRSFYYYGWWIKKDICKKAVDSLATFVALKALCNGILQLMGSQVTTEISGYKEVEFTSTCCED